VREEHPYNNSTTAFVALGSNLGDRAANLELALKLLNENPDVEVIKVSSWLENPAMEGAGPNDFLNGVAKIDTKLSPHELLDLLLEIESKIDPERNLRGRKQARMIDLDLLKYANMKIKDDKLELPHPRMQERDFVMKPLKELEGDLRQACKEEAIKVLESNPNYQIRRMYLSDLDQVAAMDPKVFGIMHWTRNIFANELANASAIYLVAEELQANKLTGKVLGYGGAWLILDEMHIMTLGTDPDQRRKKIAESIIIALINQAMQSEIKAITLEVRLSNQAAQDLYGRYQFHSQGIRKNYYESDGESALLLWTESIQDEKFQQNYLEQVKKLKAIPQAL
jgi:2-amino-4-hydroxy-6-hydroxymethyldihydropteridine diphosphokinase/ribosomal-protein-alanine acetyltransferase